MTGNEKGFLSDDVATKHFVRAEIAGLRVEMHGEFGKVRQELNGEFAKVCQEIHALAIDIDGRLRQMLMWTAGAVITSAGLTTTISGLMR